MDLRLNHEKLVSFAVSAMLTASFLATAPGNVVTAAAGPQPAALLGAYEGLKASGFQGLKEAYEPATAAAPRSAVATPVSFSRTVLTETEVQKLAKLMAAHGADMPVNAAVTVALGLTAPGETMTLRQLGVTFPNDSLIHTYNPLPNDKGTLFYVVSPASARTYYANAKQELVGAVDKKTGEAPVIIAAAVAQKELDAELAYWAALADRF